MNSKLILSGIIAITAMIASPILAEAITGLTSTTVTNNTTDYDIDFTLSGPVVTDGSDFGGYAVFTNSGDVIAVTSHKGVYDNEAQAYPNKNKTFDVCNKGNVNAGYCDATWHTHMVKPVGHSACVIAAVGALTFEQPSTSVIISGNVITVEGVPIGTISYTNSIDGTATDFTAGATHTSPNPVTNSGDGVGFPLVGVFDGKAKDKNLVAICIGPAT